MLQDDHFLFVKNLNIYFKKAYAYVIFPRIVKVGFGIGDTDFATIVGIRAWPTCPYFQFSLKERYNFSIEYHIFKESEFFQGTSLIFTYGIRF